MTFYQLEAGEMSSLELRREPREVDLASRRQKCVKESAPCMTGLGGDRGVGHGSLDEP